jgi:PAS domain S-box-containing protein
MDRDSGGSATPATGNLPEPVRQSEEHFDKLVAGIRDYAVFLLDADGNVTTWNAGAEAIKGYQASEIIGRHFSQFYPEEAIRRGWPAEELRQAAEQGRIEDEDWRVRKDGTRFWANVVITALYDDGGSPRGFLKITRDLTERREVEQRLRESEERFRLLVEGVLDYAIFRLDAEGVVQTWNAGAERITGFRAHEIVGRHFSVFYPEDALARQWPQYELEVASREGRFEDEGIRVRKDGTTYWANVIITALHDDQGRPRGFAKITRDLTERKRAEDALVQARVDLELRVDERTAELAAFNQSLRAEMAKGRRLEEELTRRVQELREKDRAKDEFLAMLAHELRNPLAPIRNALEVLKLKVGPGAELQGVNQIIDRQLRHLTRMVDDLLDVSRVTRNTLELRKSPSDLGAIVAAAVETSRPLIESQRHALTVETPSPPVVLDVDAARVAQALANLLNNAAKFTDPGGRIGLWARRLADQVEITVRDDGIGLLPEEQERIFELFVQGHGTTERLRSGLGIGLTLVKRLVEMHGGTVEARSEGRGRGTEVTIRLPAPALTASPGQRVTLKPAEAAEPPLRAPVRILVADDNEDAAESLRAVLELMGAQAWAVYNGQAALAAAAELQPQVILLDVGMPLMSGHDVARAIRQESWGGNVVLVALTGWGQDDDRRRSKEAGFDHHMVKPVEMPALRSLLEGLVRR